MISHLEDMNYIQNTNDYSFNDEIFISILYLFYFLNLIIFYILDLININKIILITYLDNFPIFSFFFIYIIFLIYKFCNIAFNLFKIFLYFTQIFINIFLAFFYLKNIYNFNIKFKLRKNNKCPICLENNTNCITSCNHHFHFTCLFKWVRKKKTCPYCRKKLY